MGSLGKLPTEKKSLVGGVLPNTPPSPHLPLPCGASDPIRWSGRVCHVRRGEPKSPEPPKPLLSVASAAPTAKQEDKPAAASAGAPSAASAGAPPAASAGAPPAGVISLADFKGPLPEEEDEDEDDAPLLQRLKTEQGAK